MRLLLKSGNLGHLAYLWGDKHVELAFVIKIQTVFSVQKSSIQINVLRLIIQIRSKYALVSKSAVLIRI